MNRLFSYWHLDLLTSIIIFALIGLYFIINRFKLKKQSGYFFAGIFLLIFCTGSPLHFLGEHYLFSAHMLSHVLIILIAAPLIVAGIPKENKMQKVFLFFSHKIGNPIICWITGVGIMWFWHIPYVFNHSFSMSGMSLMPLHTFSLLAAGMLFCWPVINPYTQYQLPPLKSVLYLSTACVFCSLLGLMITFSAPGTYAPYVQIMDNYGFLGMIRNEWKISAAADQQIAGLIMWVPCCFIYLTASMIILIKWFDKKSVSINGIKTLGGLEV